MGITGINGTMGYTGYDVGKTTGTVHKGGFDSAVSGTGKSSPAYSLHGQSDVGEGEEVKFTWIDVQNNKSYAICTQEGFNQENPVYKVKEWDGNGNVTERMIDVSKVDPRNCDAAEMYAYAVNLKDKGGSFEDTILKATIANRVHEANMRQSQSFPMDSAFSQKVNWADIVKGIMDSEQTMGNWKGYLDWKKFLSYLDF